MLSWAPFVYLGEISYAIYMVCVPWELLFGNAAAALFHLEGKQMPLWLWLIFVESLVPLGAAGASSGRAAGARTAQVLAPDG
ncbi:MAG: hypothetical protein WDM92_12310 [Caulobacteraceae bacterium]